MRDIAVRASDPGTIMITLAPPSSKWYCFVLVAALLAAVPVVVVLDVAAAVSVGAMNGQNSASRSPTLHACETWHTLQFGSNDKTLSECRYLCVFV
jgi:hypothetical protein